MAAGLDVRLQMDGEEAVVRMLGQLSLDMKDLRSAMQDVGKSMKAFFSGNVFASRGGVLGEPWPRLNASYAAQKAKQWPGRPPLVKTGLMQRSFTYSTAPMSVTIGNTAPYFKYHQASGGHRHVPRRVMLKVTAQVASDAGKIVAASLSKKILSRTK